jgi:hypothetical protein
VNIEVFQKRRTQPSMLLQSRTMISLSGLVCSAAFTQEGTRFMAPGMLFMFQYY